MKLKGINNELLFTNRCIKKKITKKILSCCKSGK